MLRKYELTLILRVTVAEADQKKILDLIKTISGKDGKITQSKDWGRKVLSYPIKKEKEGNFLHLNIEADAQSIIKLSNMLKLNDKVLRHLIVKI